MGVAVEGRSDEVSIVVAEEGWRLPAARRLLSRIERLAEQGVGTVLVDVHHIQVPSAALIGALAAGTKAVEGRGAKVVIEGVRRPLGRVLVLAGLHRVLTFGQGCRPEVWDSDATDAREGLARATEAPVPAKEPSLRTGDWRFQAASA